MIITIVISMLIVMSYHIAIFGCSKSGKKSKSPDGKTIMGKTPSGRTIVGTSVVEREDRDSTRTKVGKKQGSVEPDSTDDAFKDLAARLANKANADKTADSLVADDDENPIAAFQMPERPVVDAKQDGSKFVNIVEMEKKPKLRRGVTPQGPPTGKDRSAMQEVPKSKVERIVVLKSKKSVDGKGRISRRDDAVSTDKTQSDRGKMSRDVVERTQGSADDNNMGKTQRLSIMKNASPSLKSKLKEQSQVKKPS